MTTTELGGLTEWSAPAKGSFLAETGSGLGRFVRKKPLGAVCGLIVILFCIVGDLIPETINKVTSTAGAGQPVPYLADTLADHTSFVYPYQQQNLRARLQGPSSEHLLGTDSVGRDLFSRILYGARTAVVVSFGATIISVALQVLINVPAAYFGGWYDKIVYRLVDVSDSLPNLLILLVVFGIFGSGLWEMVVVIGVLFGFGGRYLRGQAYATMAQPYIDGARVIGAGNLRIMTRYVLPSLIPIILVTATGRLGFIVLIEATLSFLGYGLPPPFPSWGQMLSVEGREYMRAAPGLAIYPGIAIGLLVFSFNIWGDALRDVLDPRMRGS